jgi:hypothetical protein
MEITAGTRKSPMPMIAGILSIVSSALGLFVFIGLLISAIVVGSTAVEITGWIPGMGIALSTLIIFAVVFLVTAVFALVGGIFAIQGKKWGWALTGSICALFPLIVPGITAITLVALSREEYD